MGTVFGSFLTLATYRIPLGQDITHTRSYCTKCNNKLGFFEMIPVLSYIFLKGKCKNCNKKISIRYPLIEILTEPKNAIIKQYKNFFLEFYLLFFYF